MITERKVYKIIIGLLAAILLFLAGQRLFVPSNEARLKKYVEKGMGYYKYGAFDKAIEYYKKALKIKPDSAELYNDIGIFYEHSGCIGEAIDSFNKVIELDPNSASAYVNLGNILLNAHPAAPAFGFIYKARDNFKKAIEVDPDCSMAYYNLGITYNTLRLYDKAISAFEKAIEINPDYAAAYNNLGNVYSQPDLGNYQKAIVNFKKAIEIRPEYAPAYNNLGKVYYDMGLYSESRTAMRKAIELFRAQGQEAIAKQLEDILEGISTSDEVYGGGYIDNPEAIEAMANYIKDPSLPEVEIGKVYKGYTDFWEKDGFSPSKIGPPKVGDAKRRFIYAKYKEFSDGTVIVTENYPLNLKYKIISVKEINSFIDKLGYRAHYYEVSFEPVE